MISEISQRERDKYCMISYMWKLKIKKQAHRYTKQIGGYCQAGVRSRKMGELCYVAAFILNEIEF